MVGCQTASVTPQTEIEITATAADGSTREAQTAEIEPTATQTPTPESTSIASPDVAGLPRGLLFVTANADEPKRLWLVRDDGTAQLVVEGFNPLSVTTEMDVSPEGNRILYSQDGDIWLLDIASGEARNLTNTPDQYERVPRWWPGHPEGFICGAFPRSVLSPPLYGYLTYVTLSGDQQILDDEQSMASAPAPDGQTIAYTRVRTDPNDPAPNLWLYQDGTGPKQVDLPAYGLRGVEIVGDATYSPSSQQLGLALYGLIEGEQQAAVVMLDLSNSTSRILHTFEGMSIDASLMSNAPQWEPKGEWVVFLARAENEAEGGIWYADANEVRKVSPEFGQKPHESPNLPHWVSKPAISPDGQWIAVWTSSGDIGLLRVGKWQPILVDMQDKIIGVEWAIPRPGR